MRSASSRQRFFLPSPLVSHFANAFDFISTVCEVVDGRCGGCRLTLRPQFFQEVKFATQLYNCENCERFLFYNAPGSFGYLTPLARQSAATHGLDPQRIGWIDHVKRGHRPGRIERRPPRRRQFPQAAEGCRLNFA